MDILDEINDGTEAHTNRTDFIQQNLMAFDDAKAAMRGFWWEFSQKMHALERRHEWVQQSRYKARWQEIRKQVRDELFQEATRETKHPQPKDPLGIRETPGRLGGL